MSGFWKKMVRDRWVGAFAPSSRFVRGRVLRALPSRLNAVVEYGPGDGTITKELVTLLEPGGSLFVIERNHSFVEDLSSQFSDPRVKIVEGDAVAFAEEKVRNGEQVDVALSSIPLSFLSSEDRARFVKAVRASLGPGGRFIVFHQYSLLVLPLLRRHFARVRWQFEPRNFFPCFVMIADVE